MIRLDGDSLTCDQVAAVARRGDPVSLGPDVPDRVERSHRLAQRLTASRPVYGRSTGVGANRSIAVPDGAVHARSLLRSHATSAGPERCRERVRAMLVVRLNQLAAGGSGASPAVVTALAAMLAADALPTVREYGSVGTGDLAALASTALALLGEAPTAAPLPYPVDFGPHDALPLLSSNAAVVGDAALACVDLESLARSSVVVAAMTFAAVDGNPEAYAEAVERVTPFDGARQVCRWMRSLTAGSAPPSRIQDPFGLRTLPQVHGATLDALAALRRVVEASANAPAENPVVLPSADGGGALAHHGGFHAAYLGGSLDAAALAVAQSAQLVTARLAMLVDPGMTGLPPFLGDGTAGASGVMMLEYVAADTLGVLRAAATPAGVQSVTLSRGVEEDASYASQAARQVLAAVPAWRVLLACELVAAHRALVLRGLTAAGGPLGPAVEACRDLPAQHADRDLSPDVDAAGQLLPQLAALL